MEKTTDVDPSGGRPLFKKDEEPRKQRVESPKSTPGLAEVFVWASEAFDKVSEISKGYLAVKQKANMRQLTKVEANELEQMKLHVLTNLLPMKSFSNLDISNILSSNKKMPTGFQKILASKNISPNKMPMETYKKYVIGAFVDYFFGLN